MASTRVFFFRWSLPSSSSSSLYAATAAGTAAGAAAIATAVHWRSSSSSSRSDNDNIMEKDELQNTASSSSLPVLMAQCPPFALRKVMTLEFPSSVSSLSLTSTSTTTTLVLQQLQQQQQQRYPLATSSSSAATSSSTSDVPNTQTVAAPSWIRRRVLYNLGIPLPTPRLLTPNDPALQLPKKAIRQRQRDELQLRRLLEQAAQLQQEAATAAAAAAANSPDTTNTANRNNNNKLQKRQQRLGQQLFEVAYGRGVTPQQREDFLVRYGCTGWNDAILNYLMTLAESRGMVEIGAGHGQWARALNDAYQQQQQQQQSTATLPSSNNNNSKHFDFVLAFDDQSNLPLNTHIYNQYTQPHHDYFGAVRHLQQGEGPLQKVLQSWTCRGRVLLLVYPPPGPMARNVLQTYIEASPQQNDTLVYVGEGRGGANGDDAFFDLLLRSGEWILVKEMTVRKPPGNKGYEKLLVLQQRRRLLPNEKTVETEAILRR